MACHTIMERGCCMMSKLLAWVSNPIPFHSIWGIDELRSCEKERFISSEISKYVEFWKLGMSKDDSCARVMGPYVKYWESILELLSKPIPRQSFVLLEGFWPSSNWRANYEHASIRIIVDVDLEDLVILPYYGPRILRPSLNIATYTHFCDLFISRFVLVRPLDPIVYHVWMGRAKSDVIIYQENENHRKVHVHERGSMVGSCEKGSHNDEELYHNY